MIRAEALTLESYRAYGDVIGARADVKPVIANMGTAERYNFLAKVENLRPGTGEPNICLFRCNPMMKESQTEISIELLEKHPNSTQVLVPMNAGKYLVVVCLGGAKPDLSTLKAFLVTGEHGVTYRPGVWHHPLIAIGRTTDFACLVFEDGTMPGDCVIEKLDKPKLIRT